MSPIKIVIALIYLLIPAASFCEELAISSPLKDSITVPSEGFVWAQGEEEEGKPCDISQVKNWDNPKEFSNSLFFSAEGPQGSGRYWDVKVGFASRGMIKPSRGVCFTTNTLGWRTIQKLDQGPMEWLKDLDGDNISELLVWGSFPFDERESMAEYGLMTWVYKIDKSGTLTLDRNLTKKEASNLAARYKEDLQIANSHLNEVRAKIAERLEKFAGIS